MSDDSRDFEQALLDMELSGYVEMFGKTGNAVFIWQAYQLCREWGMPVREDILRMFDRMAGDLVKARTPAEQLDALRLSTRKDGGGGAAARAAARFEEKHRIMRYYRALRAIGCGYTEAISRAAHAWGWSTPKVKKAVSDYTRARPTLAPRRSVQSAVLDALPRKIHRLR